MGSRASCVSMLQVGAWLLLLAAAGPSQAARAQAPTGAPEVGEQAVGARRAVQRAEALFAAGSFDAALPEFMRAYDALAGDPRQSVLLNNIAVCHERAGRYDQALHFYERYAREARPSGAELARVQTVVDTLRNLVASVRIACNVPATVWVDGRPVGNAPGEIVLPSGQHLLELQAELHESVRRDLVITARQHYTLRFELSRLSQYRGLSPAYAWVAGGLSLGALAAAAVFGLLASGADADARRHPEFVRPGDADRVRGMQLGANIGFGVGAGLAATGLVLGLLAQRGDERGSRGSDAAGALP